MRFGCECRVCVSIAEKFNYCRLNLDRAETKGYCAGETAEFRADGIPQLQSYFRVYKSVARSFVADVVHLEA